ncbi:PaiB family negative transcriptional regulator [Paenibacillus taihuensis]|uniref:PaiB family negative transcriptional regulator n=1 Tax=Paenibacillus taihuensis TaxID=1156355 RepID=A0A3D9SF74_9BACL|nr:FMN-binding negative transcriptional regulator [Paenibacillus taihuensis]REE94552.1 PaiB family negative transcriptional regulator [Paenibacillus taihuensis]
MYIPKHTRVEDEATLFAFLERYSFATLISTSGGHPTASHLPLVLDRENRCLMGHFARANSQWTDISGEEVLAIFHGPHTYISSSWYETNQSVPTWNYAAVHAYGQAELIEDEAELLQCLNEMVAKYEEPGSAYRIDDSNRDTIDGLMKGIVGFRIRLDRLEGKWKLSQNHSKERQALVISKLEQSSSNNAQEIARLMRENNA